MTCPHVPLASPAQPFVFGPPWLPVWTPAVDTPVAQQDRGFLVQDSLFRGIPAEYSGANPIFAAYVADTTLAHVSGLAVMLVIFQFGCGDMCLALDICCNRTRFMTRGTQVFV